MNFLQSLLKSVGGLVSPQLQQAETQAEMAADKLTLAFEVLIGEGAVIIVLLLLMLFRRR